MSRTLLVLGGGGSLGAYQAGALVALLESGITPDAFFGCSAGSLNAAVLAVRPTAERARELAGWWADSANHAVMRPSVLDRLWGFAAAATLRADAVLSAKPLRALVRTQVPAHDLSELAVPLTVTTTCLDCGVAVHHDSGPVEDVLVASCSLPGLFPTVRLGDDHQHVDGGVLCGVPLEAALAVAGPEDRVLVLDCALAPVTSVPGHCAALPGTGPLSCGLPTGQTAYVAPVEAGRGALDVVLRAFTAARAAANRACTEPGLLDGRVQVLPHVADAWSAGLLAHVPAGPRDFAHTDALVAAGRDATAAWLAARAGAPAQRADDVAADLGRSGRP